MFLLLYFWSGFVVITSGASFLGLSFLPPTGSWQTSTARPRESGSLVWGANISSVRGQFRRCWESVAHNCILVVLCWTSALISPILSIRSECTVWRGFCQRSLLKTCQRGKHLVMWEYRVPLKCCNKWINQFDLTRLIQTPSYSAKLYSPTTEALSRPRGGAVTVPSRWVHTYIVSWDS